MNAGQVNSLLRLLVVAGSIVVGGALGGCASNPHGASSAPGPDSFEAGANREPNAKTLYAMARILADKGRGRDAITLLNLAIQKSPGFIPAYNELAGIYARADRLGDAIDTLCAGLKQAPRDAVLLNNLGMCHFLRAEFEEAHHAFAAAVAAVPDSALYRGNEAAALAMLGRDDEAARAYDGVIGAEAAKQNLALLNEARQRQNPIGPSTAPADDDLEIRPAVQSDGTQDIVSRR